MYRPPACFTTALPLRLRLVHSFLPSCLRLRHRSRSSPTRLVATLPVFDPLSDPFFDDSPLDPALDSPSTTFQITPSESNHRLDKILASRFQTVSRTYLQALFTHNQILLNGTPPPSKSHKPSSGDQIYIHFTPLPRDLPITPENLPLHILHEDAHLLAINKPPGMVIHPAPGNWTGTLVHALTFHYSDIRALGGPRPGIVHRLDKGTSGVLLVARTEAAQRGLMRQFAGREVRKQYVAICVGNPCGVGCVARVVDEPIGRAINDRLRMAIVAEEAGGKKARSVIKVHGSDGRGLLHAVSVGIESGRTHQIRVHTRHCRAPVLGDELYGALDVNRRFRGKVGRPMLHALRVEFEHPVEGREMVVEAKLPEDMREVMGRVVYPEFEREGW